MTPYNHKLISTDEINLLQHDLVMCSFLLIPNLEGLTVKKSN